MNFQKAFVVMSLVVLIPISTYIINILLTYLGEKFLKFIYDYTPRDSKLALFLFELFIGRKDNENLIYFFTGLGLLVFIAVIVMIIAIL